MSKYVLLELITKLIIYCKGCAGRCKTTIYKKLANKSNDACNT